jgi:D-lactate dehydrogenase
VPALPRAATRVGRRLLGEELVPLYDRSLPRGGRRRSRSSGGRQGARRNDAVAVYFPSCLGAVFAPGAGDGVQAAVERLADRAGLAVRIPDGIDRLCCGTPWTSKGLPEGLQELGDRVLPALVAATGNGRLPVLVDASSCAHGLADLVASVPELVVRDVVDFAATDLLPRLTVVERLPSLLLHPTCSSVQTGSDALRTVAAAIAEDVVVPQAWGCCAFAGDRGLLHPELTGSATAAEAAEADQRSYTAYASDNRTCEIGLERATGRPYQHVLQLLDRVTTS